MSSAALSGHFVGEPGRRVFVLARRPSGPVSGTVLMVPPFGEEMNKSRKMLTDVGQTLLPHGMATILPDLYGTGDSEGDFADGNWREWLDDLETSVRWAESQGMPITHLLGVRLGCALAADAMATERLPTVHDSVFWQPVLDGERFLQQFLRLRVAAALMEEDRKETVNELRARLDAGETLDVAGYAVSPELARGLGQMKAAELPVGLGTVHWMEIVRDAQASLPLPSQKLVDRGRASGLSVETFVTRGEPFWISTEIVPNQDLVAATVAALLGGTSPSSALAGEGEGA